MPATSRRPLPAAIVSLCLLIVAATPALADWPQDGPNDPGYRCDESNPITCSPADEQTYLFGDLPKNAPLATDPENAAGMSVDRAWADYSIGRADTLIAYVEGGINWRSGSIAELADKVFINTGELPADVRVHLQDWNGDGWISAPDVTQAAQAAGLPGVADANGNGIVDAEDVIVRFSDGVDDDGNGYVDDLSGWDFYDGQNDPATYDSAYGHANGQMEQAAAITDNGRGDAGICPMCMIVPIKAGAEALDRTEDLAQAWLYATDIGADVIVSVTADLGYSTFMRRAVEYAAHHGVLMAEASNDFDSTDHQGGMWWPHVLPGNGMVKDTNGSRQGTDLTRTYRVRSGETSWGTHNLFTVSTAGGSTSESTPTVGGVAALLLSYGTTAAEEGLIQGGPLTSFEAVQVLRATASDVADPTLPWPGKPGWDLQYGYGRPNVWKAMQAVHDGDIPPVGTIESPGWFTLVDPAARTSVPVTGHVEARRSSSYTWDLQVALGAEPADDQFTVIGQGAGTAPYDGPLGSIDLSAIPPSFFQSAFGISKQKWLETTEQYTVTLRLRVFDAQGRMGEERRSIFAQHDPAAMAGFPKRIGPSGESQPALADLNGDGTLEIVFGDADGRVHAIDPLTRRELRGWPVLTDPNRVVVQHEGVPPGHEPVLANVAVGDLGRDGHLDVVASTLTGTVYAWDAHGRRLPGWPRRVAAGVTPPPIPRPNLPYTRLPVRGATASPVLADLDGDGTLEVVQAGWDGHLHVWDVRGRSLPGWPLAVTLPPGHQPDPGHGVLVNDQKLDVTPTIADLDGDGRPEIVIRSQYTDVLGGGIQPLGVGHVHAYHADGTPVAGWPVEMRGIAEYYGSAQEFITEGSNVPVAANVDGVGGDEIAANPIFSPSYLFGGDGSVRTIYGPQPDPGLGLAAGADPANWADRGLPADVPVGFTTTGAFGRVGGTLTYAQPGTGGASIVAALLATGSGVQLKNYLRAYDAVTGAARPGFPAFQQGLNFLGAPAIADVTGDGLGEIIDGGDSSALHAYDLTGRQAEGFPKFHTGWTVFAPSVGDLDGDGTVEVVSVTREGYLFVWRTPGLASANVEWWRYQHDERNTGNYGTDARPPGALRQATVDRVAGVVRFVAPGDDWYAGRVDHYLLTLAGGERVTVPASAAAGQVQTLPLAAGAVRLQAADEAGNLGAPLELG